jgi:hypothetical protein
MEPRSGQWGGVLYFLLKYDQLIFDIEANYLTTDQLLYLFCFSFATMSTITTVITPIAVGELPQSSALNTELTKDGKGTQRLHHIPLPDTKEAQRQ